MVLCLLLFLKLIELYMLAAVYKRWGGAGWGGGREYQLNGIAVLMLKQCSRAFLACASQEQHPMRGHCMHLCLNFYLVFLHKLYYR